MHYLLIFYLLFPAFLANMAPQLATRLRIWEGLYYPLDSKKTVFGKRILGDNKTWRGYVFGVAGAMLVALVQFWLDKYEVIPVASLNGLWQFLFFGFLAGFGALLGDSVESFIKRQLNIGSGRPLLPFDQIDYLVGYLVLTSILVSWTWLEILFVLVCGVVLNPLVNTIAYLLKIKKTYW